MLEIVVCPTPDEKRKWVSNLKPASESWVVSDLQSKWHIQKELLEKHNVLEKTSVVRALELWERLSFQLLPEMHLLSNELAQTLFWNWIEPRGLPWAKSPQAVPVVLNQMKMWMSIFSDPNYPELMSEWFTENKESYTRWGHWFQLCTEIWEECQKRGLLMKEWLPALLLSQDLSRLKWNKDLIFDLGPQITQVEGQLINELAKHLNVKVLIPDAPWIGMMPNTLRPYESLENVSITPEGEWQPIPGEGTTFGRFSTQLAETKDAVARVRQWLDEGVEPQKIAVVAPDIEEYWPALHLYFKQEGIPTGKALTAKLGGFLEMARWLAYLRTAMNKVTTGDLEIRLFAQEGDPGMAFDEFRVLFSQIYDAGDLARARKFFESDSAPDGRVPLKMAEFLAWSLRFWSPSGANDRLLILLQNVGVEVPRDMELLPSQWLSYVEGILARREVVLEPGDESGIWCVSLSSADWLPATHALFLNLNESALRSLEQSPVGAGEAQRIFADTGYAVGTNDRQEREFEFLWFLRRPWKDLRLCFSGTDFQGRVLTPSRLWMWAGFLSGQLKDKPEAPLTTRWDELQRLPVSELAPARGLNEEHALGLDAGLKRDTDISVNSWGRSEEIRISASSMESYWECPFIFAASRKLKLSDEPVLDLDLDHRHRGRLLHALVERLTEEPFNHKKSDAELVALVDTCRESEKIRMGEDRLWPAIRAQHVRLGRLFLEFEREWRSRFPETKTVGREQAFECLWDVAAKGPVAARDSAPGGATVKLAGRIDRLDRDNDGRYALVDYKASNIGLTNWKPWLGKHMIQMPLYALLVEKGLAGVDAGEVAAANFFIVKDADRRKGFHLKDDSAALYDGDASHRNFISTEEKNEMFIALATMMTEALEGILNGQLNPNPEDTASCSGCSWRTLCRAPHLN